MNVSLPPLYPILDVHSAESHEIERVRVLANTLVGAGISLVQLRAKSLAAGAFAELGAALTAQLCTRGCKLLVNDRVDVALACRAAGVHLGDEDLGVGHARALLGPEAIIGYSTHSLEDVVRAPAEASYLAFGPVFHSPTKAGVREPRGLEVLREVCRISPLPVVAIGGITLERAASVWEAGAASCAVISELESASDAGALVRTWLELAARTPRLSRERGREPHA